MSCNYTVEKNSVFNTFENSEITLKRHFNQIFIFSIVLLRVIFYLKINI